MDKFRKIWDNRITVLLILANVILFLVTEINGNSGEADYIRRMGGMYPEDILVRKEYWRFFTSAFLHYGFEHLFSNMIVLGAAGIHLEHALGHVKYALLYLISAFSGSVLSYVMMVRSGDYAVSAGASGGIFGIIGGLLWVVIINKGNYETLHTKGLIFMIVLTLYYGITTAGVDNWGHVGGLLMGFAMSCILYRRKPQKY